MIFGIVTAYPSTESTGAGMPKIMITGVHDSAPAALGGLLSGDVIERLSDGRDTVEVTTPESVSGFIGVREGRPIILTYLRKGEHKEVTLLPVSGLSPSGAAIGIYMDMVGTLQLPIHKSLWVGGVKTYQYTQMTAAGIYGFIGNTITGHADFSQVTGPVGIVHAVGEAANVGVVNLLLFTALISINLAVINVLPFPALDGGRLLFIIIEAIMRKPIPAKIANGFNLGGFALLMLLMFAVTYHDIFR
jgi:regulator of sigma E protease